MTLLSAEDEVTLGRLAHAGNIAARNELFAHNRSFVKLRMRRYAPVCRDDDLLQAGLLGLLLAAEKFDPDAYPGVRFLSYAAHHVKKQMVLYLYSRPIVRITAASRRRDDILDDRPRTSKRRQEIRDWCVVSTARANRKYMHLEECCRGETRCGDLNCSWVPPDTNQLPPGSSTAALDRLEDLRTAMGSLTGIEREILDRQFGLEGRKPEHVKTIVKTMGLTIRRYRTIKSRAFTKLRQKIDACNAV